MKIKKSVRNAIRSLTKQQPSIKSLVAINQRPAIGAKRGVSEVPQLAGQHAQNSMRRQVIGVYSRLIITADGAFERPHNWPADGAYPAGTAIPDPLPDSLINDAGTLKLDVDVQYYEQKRVHLAIFEVASSQAAQLQEDWLLVPLAAPYESQGQYQGLDKPSGLWAADLQLESYGVNLSEQAQSRMTQLNLLV